MPIIGEPPALEQELQPFASTPSGVGLDVPDWLTRLETEMQRVRNTQSDLGNLAEAVFHVPKGETSFGALTEQLRDWEKRSQEESD